MNKTKKGEVFKKLSLFVAAVAVVAVILPQSAQTVDRKGFLAGAGIGGGVLHLRGAGTSRTRAALVADVKLGYGINQEWLALFNGSYQYTKIGAVNVSVWSFPVAVQWFPWKDWYVRPGVGLTYLTASTSAAGITVSTSSNISLGLDFASGYEFHLGDNFALAPEVVYHYSHIRVAGPNGHNHTFGGQVSALWYF